MLHISAYTIGSGKKIFLLFIFLRQLYGCNCIDLSSFKLNEVAEEDLAEA